MGIFLIILCVFFLLIYGMAKLASPYDSNKVQEKIYSEIKQKMSNNISQIEKMKKTDLYKGIVSDIYKYNRASCEKCLYLDGELLEYIPTVRLNFSWVYITNKYISNGNSDYIVERKLRYDKYGYGELTNTQCEILGMALIHDGHFSPDFSGLCTGRATIQPTNYYIIRLSVNMDYWNNYLKKLYTEKKNKINKSNETLKKLNI